MNSRTTNARPSEEWRAHCRAALNKFLINGVVIDNQPRIFRNESTSSGAGTIMTATKALDDEDFAIGAPLEDEQPRLDVGPQEITDNEDEDGEENDHPLDIQQLSGGFAARGKICGAYFPVTVGEGQEDDEEIVSRACQMLRHADFGILDWYLEDHSSGLTKRILRQVMAEDHAQNGRLRLLCIYTGAPAHQRSTVLDDCHAIIANTWPGKARKNATKATVIGPNVCIVVLEKSEETNRRILEILLDKFTDLTMGLLPGFVLRGVAAIRANTHHLITQFPQTLDAAYVSNRLITDPADDVSELMREIFASECDAAIGLDNVADECLGPGAISLWLEQTTWPKKVPMAKKTLLSKDVVKALLTNGLDGTEHNFVGPKKETIAFPEEHRGRISELLYNSAKGSAKNQDKFSKLVVLKREAFGHTNLNGDNHWRPSLTLGSIIVLPTKGKAHRFFYCLTPACDTVRLYGKKRRFLFLELERNEKRPSIQISSSSGKNYKLSAIFKTDMLVAMTFVGDKKVGRVLADKTDGDRYIFRDIHQQSMLWLGEVRNARAQLDLSTFTKDWMRFGILDSEYLRLLTKGKIARA